MKVCFSITNRTRLKNTQESRLFNVSIAANMVTLPLIALVKVVALNVVVLNTEKMSAPVTQQAILVSIAVNGTHQLLDVAKQNSPS